MRKISMSLVCLLFFNNFCIAREGRDLFIGVTVSLFNTLIADRYLQEKRCNIDTMSNAYANCDRRDINCISVMINRKSEKMAVRSEKPCFIRCAENIDINCCYIPSRCINFMSR